MVSCGSPPHYLTTITTCDMPSLPPGIPLFDTEGALSREFLLHRGYCCENGCRNCPYGFARPALAPVLPAPETAFRPERPPERIVSVCPSNTEILHALGLIDRIVGVDDWSDWPPEVAGLPRVGPDLNVDMDRVQALRPDLVLASLSVPGMERNVARLRERGLPHAVLDPHSLGEVWESLRIAGWVTWTESRAEQAIVALQDRIRTLRRRPDAGVRRPRLYWEWWPKPLFAPGGRNWLTALSELAGCVSVTAEVDADTARPSPEEIVRADPDHILLVWTGVTASRVRPDIVRRRPGWDRLRAVREGRVHVLEEGFFCRPSPRLVDGLEKLVALLAEDQAPVFTLEC